MGPTSFFHIKHIPTLLGLLILGAGLVGGILVVNNTNTNSFLPRAAPESQPKNVKITNVSDSGFTVSWVTDTKTNGYIQYGTSPTTITLTAQDDRTQTSGGVGLFKTHHVTLRSLRPNTIYFYKIGTNPRELYDDNGSPYQTRTVSAVQGSAQTIYGDISNSDGSPANGALIYLSSDTLAPLSALSQSTGSFVLSLAQARTKDLNRSASLQNTETLSLLVVSPTDSTTSVVAIPLVDAQPIPEIQLGISKDYTQEETLQPSTPPINSESSAAIQLQSKFTAQLLSPPTEIVESNALQIIYPSTTNQIISKSSPAFLGKAPPQTSVNISITGVARQTGIQTTTAQGNWEYTPRVPLQKGSYTITATATIAGAQRAISRTFTIDPSQTNIPTITATGSGNVFTPLPTSSPNSTAKPNPTVLASPISSQVDSMEKRQATDSTELVAGVAEYTFALLLGGVFLLGIGVYLSFSKSSTVS